jgi:thiamine pyrophosphate-dependent acetolactate synthase large subunit-like protein
MTGAEAVIKSLEREGVRYIFGYPGETATDAETAEAAVGRLLAAKGPYLLACLVDANEPSL